jgi:hypothetical protein
VSALGRRLRRGGGWGQHGDAGSGDPAYRGGGWAVPDACRLGLGRTVRHDPYRIGP